MEGEDGRGRKEGKEGWKCEFPSQNPFSRVKCGIRGMRRQNIWRGLISGSVDGIGEGEGCGEGRGKGVGTLTKVTPAWLLAAKTYI